MFVLWRVSKKWTKKSLPEGRLSKNWLSLSVSLGFFFFFLFRVLDT